MKAKLLCLIFQQRNSSGEENNRRDSDRPATTTTGKQPQDLTSEISDTTFSLPSQDEMPPIESMNSPKRVAFADTHLETEEQEIPSFEKLDVRIPVDVWVSCGEPFIPFEGNF